MANKVTFGDKTFNIEKQGTGVFEQAAIGKRLLVTGNSSVNIASVTVTDTTLLFTFTATVDFFKQGSVIQGLSWGATWRPNGGPTTVTYDVTQYSKISFLSFYGSGNPVIFSASGINPHILNLNLPINPFNGQTYGIIEVYLKTAEKVGTIPAIAIGDTVSGYMSVIYE